MRHKVGDDYLVWWDTGRERIEGGYPAMILAVAPYRGKYTEAFSEVLTLIAPRTKRGSLEMAV